LWGSDRRFAPPRPLHSRLGLLAVAEGEWEGREVAMLLQELRRGRKK